MGLYVIQKKGADDVEKPEDVGVVIEGVELLCSAGKYFLWMCHAFWAYLHTQPELSPRTQIHIGVLPETVDELGWQQTVPKGPRTQNKDAAVRSQGKVLDIVIVVFY